MVDAGVFPDAGGIGVGSDALRWLRPVRPGDALHAVVRVESLGAAPGKRSGTVRLRVWTRNQHGEDVMIQVATAQVVRRTISPP
jgi:acyl dehydratase